MKPTVDGWSYIKRPGKVALDWDRRNVLNEQFGYIAAALAASGARWRTGDLLVIL